MACKQDDLVDQFSKLSFNKEHESETDVDIPPNWLVMNPTKRGYSFRCPLPLNKLIAQNLSQTYFQRLLYIIEKENQIDDFHMRLGSSSHNGFNVDIQYKDVDTHSGPTTADICISCDTNNELSRASLIKTTSTTHIWLDAQLRNKFVLTPKRHIERLSEMTDEEMKQFWYDALVILNEVVCDYTSMIINHGKYRNHHHLHMKINIPQEQWNQKIEVKYEEKIKWMNDLFRSNSNILQQCFGDREFNQWSGIRNYQRQRKK